MPSIRAVIHVTPAARLAVAGIPLLARTVLTLWTAGISNFTLVTNAEDNAGHHAAALREIKRVAPEAELTWRRVDDAAIHEHARAVVLETKTDGIFQPALINRVIAQGKNSDVSLLFSKAGAAHLTLRHAKTTKTPHNVERLQARLGDYYPIQTIADVTAAERGLFSWCIKPTDGVVSRKFNRPISTWISRHLSHYDISPQHLTVVTGIMALATFALLVCGGGLVFIGLGCLMYHVTSVVDGLDGEIARAKYMSTPTGAALDTAVDMASNVLFMLGISIANAQGHGIDYVWIGGYVAATAVLAIATMALVLRFGPGGGSFDVLQLTIQQRLTASPRLHRAFTLINAGFKRDLFALLFAVLGLISCADAIPWLLAFGTSAWLITILVNVPAMLHARREDILPPHLRARTVAVLGTPQSVAVTAGISFTGTK